MTQAQPDYIDSVFGPDGYLAQTLPGYHPRPGQLRLTRAFQQGWDEGRHVLGEGPCGTGKTVAYLVPAIRVALESRKRTKYAPEDRRCAVVATAGIALQEQLVNKDLPLLARALPEPFTFALLKGRSNYACVSQVESMKSGHEWSRGLDNAQLSEAERVREWAEETQTGDVTELPFQPSGAVWTRFSISAEDCAREKCPHYSECHVEAARDRAKQADVVVTNLHVLFSHVRVREATAEEKPPHGRDLVLPPHDLLVLDEGHEAADTAREFFGWTLAQRSFNRVVFNLGKAGAPELAQEIEAAADDFFRRAATLAESTRDPVRLREPGVLGDVETLRNLLEDAGVHLTKAGARLREGAEARPADARRLKSEANKLAATARLCRRLSGEVAEAARPEDPNRVVWVDGSRGPGPGKVLVEARTLDVSGVLADYMFEPCRSVWVTSATLRTSGGAGSGFSFLRRELGVPGDPIELAVPSPFDLSRQSVLVVARGVPDSQKPEYPAEVGRRLREVVELAQGRTLALFTSWRVLNLAREHLRGLPYRVLVQGEGSREELVRIFREDVHSVLLGVSSMWTGVDVPGESLSCLVVEKLPFPRKGDPMVDAHQDVLGRKFFGEYSLPRAVVSFRQGAGRLIRAETDRGVVVVLDGRVCDKPYGAAFVEALGDVPLTRDLGEVGAFFARGEEQTDLMGDQA